MKKCRMNKIGLWIDRHEHIAFAIATILFWTIICIAILITYPAEAIYQ